jgi:hypothetical protein
MAIFGYVTAAQANRHPYLIEVVAQAVPETCLLQILLGLLQPMSRLASSEKQGACMFRTGDGPLRTRRSRPRPGRRYLIAGSAAGTQADYRHDGDQSHIPCHQ